MINYEKNQLKIRDKSTRDIGWVDNGQNMTMSKRETSY